MIIQNPILTGSVALNGLNLTATNLATTSSNSFTSDQSITGSLGISANTTIAGTLTVTGSIVGLATSASYVLNAVSSSKALSASYSDTASFANSFNVAGNLTASNAVLSGTLTAQTLVVQTITSSIDFVTGSTRFGSLLTNTHTFTGSVSITGSLTVNTTGTEFQVTNNGVVMGNLLTDSHSVTGSFRVTGSLTSIGTAIFNSNALVVSSSGNVGIGVASPTYNLQVLNTIGLRANSVDFQAIKGTGFGYSPASYKVVMLGTSASSEFTTVSIGYDPAGNANASFNGSGIEVLFRRGVQFVTPNSANNNYYLTNLVLQDGNVAIGNTSPQASLHIGPSLNTVPASTSIAVAGDTSIRFMAGSDGNANYGSYIAGTQYSGVRALSLGYRQGAGDILTMTVTQLSLGVGAVGIGTTSPTTTLDVNGSVGHNNGSSFKSIEFFKTISASTSATNLYTVTINTGNTAVFYEVIVFGTDWSGHSAARTIKRGFFCPNGSYTAHNVVESAGLYAANITLGYSQSSNTFTTTLTLDSGTSNLFCHIRLVGDILSYS